MKNNVTNNPRTYTRFPQTWFTQIAFRFPLTLRAYRGYRQGGARPISLRHLQWHLGGNLWTPPPHPPQKTQKKNRDEYTSHSCLVYRSRWLKLCNLVVTQWHFSRWSQCSPIGSPVKILLLEKWFKAHFKMSMIGVQVQTYVIQASVVVINALQNNVTRLMEKVEHRSGAMYSIGYPSETHLKLKSCAVSFAHNLFSGARSFLNFAQNTAVCRALCKILKQLDNRNRC